MEVEVAVADRLDAELKAFLAEADFVGSGAIVTDLDGTAVHEFEGRIAIPDSVSHALKHLNDLGRPVILNTLRFPLNVIRTFGREWYAITNAPLPLVSLNGGIVGYLREDAAENIVYEEIAAFPLEEHEIDEVLTGVRGLLANGIDDLLLFYYSRDWVAGETIWTPVPEKLHHLHGKYRSASRVESMAVEELRSSLMSQDICMIFLLIEAPEDRLMAYQHIKRSSFVTRRGVDKLFGARAVAERLGIDLRSSVGCGDTPMDSFLAGVGLAIHVGPLDLEYKGLVRTIKIESSIELGKLLFRLGQLQSGASQ